MTQQIGQSNEAKLLYNIVNQLKFLTEVASKNTGGGGTGASISDAVYSGSWNADTSQGASRNALYDKLNLIDGNISSLSSSKQNNLVNGVNIKTLNGVSILGAGDIVISGGGGSTTFSALTDTPASYTGQAGKFTKVNSGETALEFANAFDVYSDSPIKPIFWGSTQAEFDVKFPSGAPTNVFSVITDAVTPPIEGTDISSTAVTAGHVLQADGDGTSSWVAPSGGSDFSEFLTSTGTRLGGDLVTTIGDYDDSGNGTRLFIDDASKISMLSTIGSYLAVRDTGIQLNSVSNTATESIYLKTTNVTSAKNIEFPNASGTIALTSDLIPYLTTATASSTYEPLKGVDDNYVTDAEKVVIGNTSGTNTGDQDLSGKQDVLISGTNIKTINSTSILGAGDIVISGGGGSSNPSIRVATTQSHLTTPLTGQEKEISIQGNITLTSNITFAANAIISDGGGSVDVNGYKVLFQNNSFGNLSPNKTIMDFSYFGTTTQGFTAVGGESIYNLSPIADIKAPVTVRVNGEAVRGFNINLQSVDFVWSPLSAGDVVEITYTPVDDRSRIDAASTFKVTEIWAKWFGLTDTNDSALFDNHNVLRNALAIVNYNGGKLNVNAGHYYVGLVERGWFTIPFSLYAAEGVTVSGQGMDNTILHQTLNALNKSEMFTTLGKATFQDMEVRGGWNEMNTTQRQLEHPSGIVIGNDSDGSIIQRCRLTYWTGDGVNGDAVNTDFPSDFMVFEDGTIDESTGAEVASTVFQRSAIKIFRAGSLPITGTGRVMLSGIGYRSYVNMSTIDYRIFFYDALDAYIGQLRAVAYKDVFIPDNATKYRVVIDTPIGVVSQAQLRSPQQSKYVKILDCDISYNYRNGISNRYQGWQTINCFIHDNGGRSGGPSYGIDDEDGFMELTDVQTIGNTFQNNVGGDLIVVQVREGKIMNNIFLGNSKLGRANGGISVRESWGMLIENNTLYGGANIKAGRNTTIKYNMMIGGNIVLVGSNSQAIGNTIYNGSIQNSESDKPDRSLSMNNIFYIERPNIYQFFGQITSINDVVVIRNNISLHEQWFYSGGVETGTDVFPTKIDNLIITGDTPAHVLTGTTFRLMKISNSSFSQPLYLTKGKPTNHTLKNNTYKGYIQFGWYDDDGTGGGETISLIGGVLDTDATYCPNFSYAALRSRATYNKSLYFEEITFNLTDVAAVRAMALNHTGTTTFKDCTWNIIADAIDVTGSTCSAIHFIDCTMPTTTNIRASDNIRFTKPHPNLPIYANNEEALADGYDIVGDVYKTATGDYKIVY